MSCFFVATSVDSQTVRIYKSSLAGQEGINFVEYPHGFDFNRYMRVILDKE